MDAVANNTQAHSAAPPREHVALAPGDVLDQKYRLDFVLGAGAMGQVWCARNIMLDLPVAIKVVQPSHGQEAIGRLLTEARFEAQLSHPNIVRVLDVRADSAMAYVVMELLEGCTLADLMDEGPLPPALAVRIALPLLDGLCAAHRAGIVHRDIKPENVFIARGAGGRVYPKLLDFGIAQCEVSGNANAPRERVVMGTPGYMSPEQAWGEACVDQRSDIWALGVVLHEAICGQSAYACTDYLGFLRALDERELSPLPGEASAELWTILRRATTKAYAERFPSSHAFAKALSGFLRDRGVFEDLTGDSLPQHWATPGSLIDRAFRRAHERGSASARHDSYARTRVGKRPEEETTAMGPHDREVLHTGREEHLARMRTKGRPLSHERTRNRLFQLISLLTGALLGVSITLSRTHGRPRAEPRAGSATQKLREPSVVPASAAASSIPAGLGMPVVTHTDTASLHATPKDASDSLANRRAKAKKSTNKRSGPQRETREAPKDSPRDGSTHRLKARRAYAINAESWNHAPKRVAGSRAAPELGARSTW
jgi:serine/threonine-protein kinase